MEMYEKWQLVKGTMTLINTMRGPDAVKRSKMAGYRRRVAEECDEFQTLAPPPELTDSEAIYRAIDIDFGRAVAIKRGQINVWREERLLTGVEFDGHRYDSDDRSRANVSGLVAALAAGVELPAGFSWRTADNIEVPMTAQEAVAFGAAMLGHVNTVYAASKVYKDALEAAETVADVREIVLPRAAG